MKRYRRQVYETWFTPVVLDRIEDTTAYLAVPNKFFGDWLDEHYRDLLTEAVSVAQGGGHLDVSFVINNRKAPASVQQDSSARRISLDGASWFPRRGAACS